MQIAPMAFLPDNADTTGAAERLALYLKDNHW